MTVQESVPQSFSRDAICGALGVTIPKAKAKELSKCSSKTNASVADAVSDTKATSILTAFKVHASIVESSRLWM